MKKAVEPPFVVKICGITNEEDARVALEAGANALGFNFYPGSARFLLPADAERIVNSLPGDYLKVGIFVNSTEDEMLKVADRLRLDVLQLHGERCAIPASASCGIWRAIAPQGLPRTRDARMDAYLVDTPTADFGGSGKTFDWSIAAGRAYRIILAGGLASSNVEEAIETVQPWGVDACSRLESKPGKKDARQMREFIHTALAASQAIREAAR
jgi:phosphoribosylanthranilate isomerase